ncbi:MAG: hypothetical protein IK092_07455, partial [Muribaculaceae bacterium]|nr:hypothetical protein [Muribaculaceae bacterium]
MPKNESQGSRHVLIMRFSALGDVAIAVPVVYPLCHANPDVQFFFATQSRIATILINKPKNLTVIPLDVKGDEGSARKMWQWAKKIRKQFNIDAVADIHSVLRTWVVDSHMRLHGVKVVRIDKGRSEKRALTSQRVNRQLTTSGERYKNVFAQLELDTSGEVTSILHYINPAEE